MAKAERSPHRCRALCLKPAGSPPTSFTDCMADGVPAPAKVSGSIAASFPANRRSASTGGARRATIISMSASRNGRPRTRCGSGRTVRRRWRLRRKQARDSKLERALIVAFALAELLVAGGERVGIPGLMNPTASRSVIDKMAQAMLHDDAARLSLPPSFVPSPLAEIVVLSDFWSPIADIRSMLAGLSASGAHGTLIQIVDPAEETFPYSGRIEFVEPEGFGKSSPRAAPNDGPAIMPRGSRCIATRSAPRPTSSTGCLQPTPPAARPPNCCCSCIRRHDSRASRCRHATSRRGAAHDRRPRRFLSPNRCCCWVF